MKFIEGRQKNTSLFQTEDRSGEFWYWINNVAFPIAKRDIWSIVFEETLACCANDMPQDEQLAMCVQGANIQAIDWGSQVETRKTKLSSIESLIERMCRRFADTKTDEDWVLPNSQMIVILPRLLNKQSLNLFTGGLILHQTQKMVRVAERVGGQDEITLIKHINNLPRIPSEFFQ